ncbi:MAG: fibronectin type III domain-containing protein [Acidobacteria bacterium]|nr:fibronectin type III domain-containing protein [Acidobacteriota bacterium]
MFLTTTKPHTETTNPLHSICLAVLIAAAVVGSSHQSEAIGLLFYGLEDGQVRAMDMLTTGDSGISIPSGAFFGTPPTPATGRNIAYDPSTDLLWYSASDNHVHSVVVSTLAAGPTISDINDGFYGAIRTIAIDRNARRLYISNSNGNVEVYELYSNTRMYTIPLSAFGYSEPNPGNRRHLAADADGFLWYAAADGAFKEFDPFEYNPHFTGREIPVSEQIETGNPGQERCFVAVRWPAGQNYLYYASSDGTIRTANLDTLMNVNITYLASWFWTTSNPGALRSLAIDPTWTPSGDPPAVPTGISATDGLYLDRVWINWNAGANFPTYQLFRREPGDGDWTFWITAFGPEIDDTWVVPGVIYEYAVKACNQWGCSDLSTDTDTGYAAVLSAPTGLTATEGTLLDRVRLVWDAVPGANGYLLGVNPYDGGVPYTVWVDGTTYDDMDALPAGSLWEYWVYACTDPSSCSGSSGSVWGWIGTFIFVDGFESGDLSEWSSVVQ